MAALSGLTRELATGHERMQEGVREMRQLIVILHRWSRLTIEDEGELGDMNSGNVWEKGTT
jgi:hypothetical protein